MLFEDARSYHCSYPHCRQSVHVLFFFSWENITLTAIPAMSAGTTAIGTVMPTIFLPLTPIVSEACISSKVCISCEVVAFGISSRLLFSQQSESFHQITVDVLGRVSILVLDRMASPQRW
jgi:hypothetical protein